MRSLGFVWSPFVAVSVATGACGGAPEPALAPAVAAGSAAPVAHRAAAAPDDCVAQPGKPPPEPLERAYVGLAAKARCQREVDTIMDGVARSLGVSCDYCHLVPDYRAMTHRKEIANWMAAELIPTLRKKGGGEVWCDDCHTRGHKGVAKILGEPRKESFAIEWMTSYLVEDFATQKGAPLHCKSCHQGNVGTPEFQPKVILTHHLPRD